MGTAATSDQIVELMNFYSSILVLRREIQKVPQAPLEPTGQTKHVNSVGTYKVSSHQDVMDLISIPLPRVKMENCLHLEMIMDLSALTETHFLKVMLQINIEVTLNSSQPLNSQMITNIFSLLVVRIKLLSNGRRLSDFRHIHFAFSICKQNY